MLMTFAGRSLLAAARSAPISAWVRKNGVFMLRSTTLSQPFSGKPSNFSSHAAPPFTSGTRSFRKKRSVAMAPCRARARDPAEPRAVGQPGPAGIVEPEDAADQLARGVETGNRLAVGRDHLRIRVDLQAAEAERDAAGHSVGFEGRRVDGVRPVGLVDSQVSRAPAVLHVGIEGNLGVHREVVVLDFAQFLRLVGVLELAAELFQR